MFEIKIRIKPEALAVIHDELRTAYDARQTFERIYRKKAPVLLIPELAAALVTAAVERGEPITSDWQADGDSRELWLEASYVEGEWPDSIHVTVIDQE